jgi:hypothetical protein
MDTANELLRAKEELTGQRIVAYQEAMNGVHSYEVSPGKNLLIAGGVNTLVFLQSGYEAHFVDPDVPKTEASIMQVDGSYITCTAEEWTTLLKAMRAKGNELFGKNEKLTGEIEALSEDDSFKKIWDTTFENTVYP